MTKLALTAAAIFVATCSAFAGSDHFASRNANQTVATIDNAYTASIRRPDMGRHGVQAAMKTDADEPDQGIWGR